MLVYSSTIFCSVEELNTSCAKELSIVACVGSLSNAIKQTSKVLPSRQSFAPTGLDTTRQPCMQRDEAWKLNAQCWFWHVDEGSRFGNVAWSD